MAYPARRAELRNSIPREVRSVLRELNGVVARGSERGLVIGRWRLSREIDGEMVHERRRQESNERRRR